jgi:16S rRNA (adenine1518-N6/adenine1519-N6)-dimethyltransferase
VTGYRALRDRGVRSDKRLGQHILVDPQAVLRIVDAADLCREDVVLEVGPGPGTLTVHLAQRAGQVIAVEVDERMLAPLRGSLQGCDNVRIVHGDILEQDVSALAGGSRYKVVANLPYYITSAVLRHLLESAIRPGLLVVTVQREVAERIVGRSGKGRARRGGKPDSRMSLLAVSVQFYGVPRIVARIRAGAFRPIPAVDSAVVRIDVYDPLPWAVADRALFFRVARAGFAQPRKQLQNTLTRNLAVPKDRVLDALHAAGVDGKQRPETLSVQDWVALTNALDLVPRDRPRPS